MKFSDLHFCAEELAENAIKTCKNLKNFVKLGQNHEKSACFSCFAFKRTNFPQIHDNFAQTCVSTSSTFRSSGFRPLLYNVLSDILKVNYFARSTFSLIQFWAELCAEIVFKKKPNIGKNFIKLCQKHEKVTVLQG